MGALNRLPPFACPNLSLDGPLRIDPGRAEAFDKVIMRRAHRSEDEPWGRFGRCLKALSGVEGQANGGKRMSVWVAAGLPAEGSACAWPHADRSAQAGVRPAGGG